MLIEVSNTLTVENPTPEMVLWCKRNLTIPNPDYAKKSRMNLWLGNTPKVLSLYETRGTTLVLPFGTLRLLPKDISDKALFLSEFAAPVEVNYNADVPLYDYQETAVQAMVAAKYGILQSAAGSGKTQMGIALAARLGRRTLWLCHTLDLIKQSKERAKLYMSEDLMGTITEGKVNLGKGITFATIQTMCKLDLAQYRDYWDCVITDEVHRVSGSPTAVTQYQKVLNSLSARHKYGLSATVHRSDGMIKATYALVGEVAYKVPDEAVADKIMKVGIYPVGTGVQISREALNTDGTLNYTKLITYLTENAARNQLIADSLEDMRSGKKKYLFATYSLAKEGLDVPWLERLYLTTPQKDYAVVTQSIGRIARTFDGKSDPIAYDFVDDIAYLVKSYKKRCTTYRKNGCYFVKEGGTSPCD